MSSWIPTKSRLPEQRDYYLACNTRGEVFVADFIPAKESSYKNQWWNVMEQTGRIERVVAWQDMPQPYKENDDDYLPRHDD